MIKLEDALEIAKQGHKGQFRRDGVTPYVEHPIKVADRMTTHFGKVIALCHDLLEDTDETLESLAAKGIPQDVLKVVEILSKKEGEDYFTYLSKIKDAGCITEDVKLADMICNMTEEPTRKQAIKYFWGLVYLFHHIIDCRIDIEESEIKDQLEKYK